MQHIVRKISIQLALDFISIGGLHTKLWAPKIVGVSTLGISGLPNTWESWNKMTFGCWSHAKHKVYYKGEGGDFPKFGSWWVLWVRVCPWLVCASKCSNYALTNLLFGLCKFVWASELFITLPSPIPEFQHTPLPPKCYELRSVPQLFLLPLFSPLDLQLSPSRNLGLRHTIFQL
jgi:hypothetical protein